MAIELLNVRSKILPEYRTERIYPFEIKILSRKEEKRSIIIVNPSLN